MKILSLSQLDEQLEEIRQKALDSGAVFLKKRVKSNYYKASVEGMPSFVAHKQSTTDRHGPHPLFNLTGEGIETVDIRDTVTGNKQVFTENVGLNIAEKGYKHQEPRPLFKRTADSPFTKRDLIEEIIDTI